MEAQLPIVVELTGEVLGCLRLVSVLKSGVTAAFGPGDDKRRNIAPTAL